MEIADEVIVLKEGQVVLAGQTTAVLTPSSLGEVFGVDLAGGRLTRLENAISSCLNRIY